MNSKKYLIFSIIVNTLFTLDFMAIFGFSRMPQEIFSLLFYLMLFLLSVIFLTLLYGLFRLLRWKEITSKKYLLFGIVVNILGISLIMYWFYQDFLYPPAPQLI